MFGSFFFGKVSRVALLGGIAVTAAISSASAAALTITSNAFGISVNLDVTPAIAVGVGPLAATGGTAAPAYDNSVQVLSVNQSLGLGSSLGLTFAQGVQTGVLTSTASALLGGAPTGTATATVNDLSLGLTSQAVIGGAITILNIGATTLTSTSSVEGFGTPSANGSASITGLTIGGSALGGLVINGAAFANPAANTELLNLLGLRIVLNEQTPSGNNVTSAGIMTNAIHIGFTNFLLGTELLNGDIIVAHSDAAIADVQAGAVPEPAVWAQLLMGFGAIGALARRRTRRVAA